MSSLEKPGYVEPPGCQAATDVRPGEVGVVLAFSREDERMQGACGAPASVRRVTWAGRQTVLRLCDEHAKEFAAHPSTAAGRPAQ